MNEGNSNTIQNSDAAIEIGDSDSDESIRIECNNVPRPAKRLRAVPQAEVPNPTLVIQTHMLESMLQISSSLKNIVEVHRDIANSIKQISNKLERDLAANPTENGKYKERKQDENDKSTQRKAVKANGTDEDTVDKTPGEPEASVSKENATNETPDNKTKKDNKKTPRKKAVQPPVEKKTPMRKTTRNSK